MSVNGSYQAVCVKDSTSYKTISKVVCQELSCGIPLIAFQGPVQTQGQISDVECHGQEKSLWECMHTHGIVDNCQIINILCSGNGNAGIMFIKSND